MTESYTGEKEIRRASRVIGFIEAIDSRDPFPKIFSDEAKQKLGKVLAEQILTELPNQVYAYTHSSELKEIPAERDNGGNETWNKSNAIDWASEILNS